MAPGRCGDRGCRGRGNRARDPAGRAQQAQQAERDRQQLAANREARKQQALLQMQEPETPSTRAQHSEIPAGTVFQVMLAPKAENRATILTRLSQGLNNADNVSIRKTMVGNSGFFYEVDPDTENPISDIEGEFAGNKILLAEMEVNEDVRQDTATGPAQGEDGEEDEQYDANLLY